MLKSTLPAFWCLSLATMLLASAYQTEAQYVTTSHVTGDSASPTASRRLRQWVGNNATVAPQCDLGAAGYCRQENACLPGSLSLDNATYCACCRPRFDFTWLPANYFSCGFSNCNENQWAQALSLPPVSYSPPPPCTGKWITCNACPNGTFSPRGSDSPYDCKRFEATAPTCYLLKNLSNPDVKPFPGMYFWPLNYTALNLQRLASGACAGHGLPVQVCLGSNHWSGPNATLYQMWFIMEDGTRLSPFATAGTNRGNYVIGFMPTSNSTCKWPQRNSLYYMDGPDFEISGTEVCTRNNVTTYNFRRFKFTAPSKPYCTPSLVVI